MLRRLLERERLSMRLACLPLCLERECEHERERDRLFVSERVRERLSSRLVSRSLRLERERVFVLEREERVWRRRTFFEPRGDSVRSLCLLRDFNLLSVVCSVMISSVKR